MEKNSESEHIGFDFIGARNKILLGFYLFLNFLVINTCVHIEYYNYLVGFWLPRNQEEMDRLNNAKWRYLYDWRGQWLEIVLMVHAEGEGRKILPKEYEQFMAYRKQFRSSRRKKVLDFKDNEKFLKRMFLFYPDGSPRTLSKGEKAKIIHYIRKKIEERKKYLQEIKLWNTFHDWVSDWGLLQYLLAPLALLASLALSLSSPSQRIRVLSMFFSLTSLISVILMYYRSYFSSLGW